MTLPASPSVGYIVGACDSENNWETSNLTVDRNGSKIKGQTENLVCNSNGASFQLIYSGPTRGWVFEEELNGFLSTGSTEVLYGTEVDFLGSATDVSVNIPTGYYAWIEETGWVVTVLTLDGGTLTTQPTIRAGIVGDLAKYKAAVATTLLTAVGKRARYTTLLQDDRETTFSAGMTVAGAITGGGGNEEYKGVPYWVVRLMES